MCPENENPLDNTKRIYIEDTIFIEKYTSLTS
jgi:hypothetical protein